MDFLQNHWESIITVVAMVLYFWHDYKRGKLPDDVDGYIGIIRGIKKVISVIFKTPLVPIFIFLFIVGCASISVEDENIKASYTRIGDQQIRGLKIERTTSGFQVMLEGQASQADALTEAIKLGRESVAKIP